MYLHKAPSAAPGLRGDAPDLFLGASALISKPQDPWVQHRFSKHPDFATKSHINSSGNEFGPPNVQMFCVLQASVIVSSASVFVAFFLG